jgi:hypothetical protein
MSIPARTWSVILPWEMIVVLGNEHSLNTVILC